MVLITKYAKNFTKSNFFIVLPFIQIVIAFKNTKVGYTNSTMNGTAFLGFNGPHFYMVDQRVSIASLPIPY